MKPLPISTYFSLKQKRDYREDKTKIREQLEKDTEIFLKKGKKIEIFDEGRMSIHLYKG